MEVPFCGTTKERRVERWWALCWRCGCQLMVLDASGMEVKMANRSSAVIAARWYGGGDGGWTTPLPCAAVPSPGLLSPCSRRRGDDGGGAEGRETMADEDCEVQCRHIYWPLATLTAHRPPPTLSMCPRCRLSQHRLLLLPSHPPARSRNLSTRTSPRTIPPLLPPTWPSPPSHLPCSTISTVRQLFAPPRSHCYITTAVVAEVDLASDS